MRLHDYTDKLHPPKLHVAAAEIKGRYAIDHVLVSPVAPAEGDAGAEPRVRAVATDGRILAVATFAADPDEQYSGLVSPNAWKAACDVKVGKRTEHHALKLDGAGKVATVAGIDGSVSTMPIATAEGEFPKYQAVMPEIEDDDLRISINPNLLMRLYEALGASKDKSSARVTLRLKVGAKLGARFPNGYDKAIHVATENPDSEGAIMPITIE